MRVINGILYFFLFLTFFVWMQSRKKKEGECSVFTLFIRKHMPIWGLLLFVNCLSFGMTFWKESGDIYVKRQDYDGTEQKIALLLEKGETTEQVILNVSQKKFAKKEREEKMQEAFAYLKDHIKGKNASLSKVTEKLDFTIDYERYPFDAEFLPEDYALMDENGNLKNERKELLAGGYSVEDLTEGISTNVVVTLWYGEESEKRTYKITIFPKEENEVQKLFAGILEKMKKKEKETFDQEGLILPAKVDGVKITRIDESRMTPFRVLVIGIIFVGLLLLKEKEDNRQAEQKRREVLQRCYPWFVNELVLLLGAGMQVKNIFNILLKEYEREEDFIPLMAELRVAKHSMEIGMSEEQAYYQLGRRLKLPCYIKLMTLLEQNVKRGAKGLTTAFEQEEFMALEERKNLAKRYGEEAGTKLLGPMVLLLLVIMFMIMIPAFLTFQ